jgi:hypothetical protein
MRADVHRRVGFHPKQTLGRLHGKKNGGGSGRTRKVYSNNGWPEKSHAAEGSAFNGGGEMVYFINHLII